MSIASSLAKLIPTLIMDHPITDAVVPAVVVPPPVAQAFGSQAVAPFSDPQGRCACINSSFSSANSLGPALAVCFDGNCHPNGPAYFTDSFLQAQMDTGGSCISQCGGVSQICIAAGGDCSQNTRQIDTVCGEGTANPEPPQQPPTPPTLPPPPLIDDHPDDGLSDDDDGPPATGGGGPIGSSDDSVTQRKRDIIVASIAVFLFFVVYMIYLR